MGRSRGGFSNKVHRACDGHGRPLIDVLVELAAARGARLDFVLGDEENTDTLRNELGGIADLTRF